MTFAAAIAVALSVFPVGPANPERDQRAEPRTGVEITARGSDFGTMLFNGDRQAIYLFDKEKGSKSRCYGACAREWPPVLTKGKPRATSAVKARLLGTTKRRNGSRQVTYAGRPLYYYAHEGPGEVLCHNVFSFDGLWQVVRPSGKPAP